MSDSEKNSARGRPPVDTEAVNVRLSRVMIGELDEQRKRQPDLPTRPEMIRRILQAWIDENPIQD